MPHYLVHDIETIPETEVAHHWIPTEEEIQKAKGDPFPPHWAHKIITIGGLVLDTDLKVVRAADKPLAMCLAGGAAGGESERAMVQRWNDVASGRQLGRGDSCDLVDFNGRGFDVPVLQYRSFHYGIPMPWYLGLLPDPKAGGKISPYSKTYRDRFSPRHQDVSELWNGSGQFPRCGLKHLAELVGLPGKTGVDGSQTYQMWKDKRLAEIDAYCMQDVFQTAFIFMRWKNFTGDVDVERYRAAAGELLKVIDDMPEHADFAAKINRGRLLLQD